MTNSQTTAQTPMNHHSSQVRLAACGPRGCNADCQPEQPAQSRANNGAERCTVQRLGGLVSAVAAGPRFSAGRDCISSFLLGAAVLGRNEPSVVI
jgi:hypothetical protein